MSSLKVLIVDANKNISRVYLKREDIESVTFGTEVVKNPNYDSVKRDKKGVEYVTKAKRTVSIPDYWATSDKEQFEFIENWAQNNL